MTHRGLSGALGTLSLITIISLRFGEFFVICSFCGTMSQLHTTIDSIPFVGGRRCHAMCHVSWRIRCEPDSGVRIHFLVFCTFVVFIQVFSSEDNFIFRDLSIFPTSNRSTDEGDHPGWSQAEESKSEFHRMLSWSERNCTLH